jgi:hypothetical protein
MLSGCGAAASPSPPVGSAAPAAAIAEVAPSATASTTAEPASTATSTAAPASEAPKTPAPSPSRKAVLVDQPKGTPLAVIEVRDGDAACTDKPSEGNTTIELSLYWKPGTYVIGTRTKTASIRVRRFEGGKWKTLPDAVKGEVQVIDAPIEQGKSGRIHIHGDRAGQAIDDDFDVVLCVPFDPSKAK